MCYYNPVYLLILTQELPDLLVEAQVLREPVGEEDHAPGGEHPGGVPVVGGKVLTTHVQDSSSQPRNIHFEGLYQQLSIQG